MSREMMFFWLGFSTCGALAGLTMTVYFSLRQMRLIDHLRSSSPVRTEEFTVPLKQVGWGWGYGTTRWYRPGPPT